MRLKNNYYSDLLLLLLLLLGQSLVLALHKEDAGLFDFRVATSGHDVTRFAYNYKNEAVITSDVQASKGVLPSLSFSSCYMASRSTTDGTLLWRRNVCAKPLKDQKHAIIATKDDDNDDDDMIFTLDQSGTTRAWMAKDGSLSWEERVQCSLNTTPRLFFIRSVAIAAVCGDRLTILDAKRGNILEKFTASDTLSQASIPAQPQVEQKGDDEQGGEQQQPPTPLLDGEPRWIDVISSTSQDQIYFVAGLETNNDDVSLASLAAVHVSDENGFQLGEVQQSLALSASNVEISISKSAFVLDENNGGWSAYAPTVDGLSVVYFTKRSTEPIIFPTPGDGSQVTSLEFIEGMNGLVNANLVVSNGKKLVAFLRGPNDWDVIGDAIERITYCPGYMIGIERKEKSILTAWTYNGDESASKNIIGDATIDIGADTIASFSAISCNDKTTHLVVGTVRGTTLLASLTEVEGSGVEPQIVWSQEDGLAHISSAVLLDGSHIEIDDAPEDEKEKLLSNLELSARIQAQIDSIAFLAQPSISGRDHMFGFVKSAVLLSQNSHRIWGMATTGSDRGSIRWHVDLPEDANWHTIVHGDANGPQAEHGIIGVSHSREMLALSSVPQQQTVEWTCLDGASGNVRSQGSVRVASPVLQVVPVYGGGDCHQSALLFHQDNTLTVIPGDEGAMTATKLQIEETKNGMFTHVVKKESSEFQSFQIVSNNNDDNNNGGSLTSRQVGRLAFPGERIVDVKYPIEGESVQSLSTILGDNSLLLKYMNPHLAVIVTVSEDNREISSERMAKALAKKTKEPTVKRKVVSADIATPPSVEEVPNLFVNVIDSNSARVLYRASHANANPHASVSTLISENWILYTFTNQKTQRTEIGVLTLHDGMVDSKGISAFTPIQRTSHFSSFDARESKPVVLAKTYTFPKEVTALGATSSRAGISNRHILMASVDNKIVSIERKLLETRRPTGEVKEAEKTEGLFQYRELVPAVPLMTLSYDQSVESATSIISVPTALESQSLVMAYGGPDIFFTRTSPSKGFDLLPESFNKVLVSIVVVGLGILLLVLGRMASRKTTQQGWT